MDAETKRKRLLLLQQQNAGPDRMAAGREIQQRNALRFQAGTGQKPPVADDSEANRIAERDMARAQMGRLEAGLTGFASGQTLGFSDEIAGAIGGDEMNQAFDKNLEVARTAYPGMTTAAEIGGTIASPVAAAAPVTRSIRGAAAVGAGVSAVDAAGRAEGSAVERVPDAVTGAGVGFLTAGLASGAFKGLNTGARKLFQRAEARPTIESLRTAKNAAYAAVRKAGVEFTPDEMQAAFQRLGRKAKTSRFDLDPVSETDKASFDALRVLQRRADLGRPISLNNLDKTRQKLWDIYNKSDQPFVLEAIGEIDGLIAAKSSGNDVMTAARAANAAYSKTQLLQNAFDKAELQTAGSGSGGNILNKYRQAVTRIITTPREAKWFSEQELTIMREFVMGDMTENTLRRAGKLAPGGNGLMTALNVYAASIDPSLLAITGAASAAKGMADRSAMKGSQDLLDTVATGAIRAPAAAPNLTPAAVTGSATGNRL